MQPVSYASRGVVPAAYATRGMSMAPEGGAVSGYVPRGAVMGEGTGAQSMDMHHDQSEVCAVILPVCSSRTHSPRATFKEKQPPLCVSTARLLPSPLLSSLSLGDSDQNPSPAFSKMNATNTVISVQTEREERERSTRETSGATNPECPVLCGAIADDNHTLRRPICRCTTGHCTRRAWAAVPLRCPSCRARGLRDSA